MNEQLVLTVSDFVAVLNQTLDYAYPSVAIIGELSNFKVSKNKWIYFDLKDDNASVRFFGTIYALPGPLEDGMKLQVTGAPRLHSQFGFSVTAQKIQPVGEGSIKKAAELLLQKLTKEGLFAADRKRQLPYPPQRIGLIASKESAGYADFIKILGERWGGIDIVHVDVQVQGEAAPGQIVAAFEKLNTYQDLDAIAVTRGGGSADDLQAFSHELVVRAVAASRTPTIIAIGHEVDISLAEMAADVHASTPSNAAELLVPDRRSLIISLEQDLSSSTQLINRQILKHNSTLDYQHQDIKNKIISLVSSLNNLVAKDLILLGSYDPRMILKRGYASIKKNSSVVRSVKDLKIDDSILIRFSDGSANAQITNIKKV